MGFSLEWHCDHCSTLRLGSDHAKFGDPYEFACTLVVEGQAVIMAGATSALKQKLILFRTPLFEHLLSMGIREIKAARLKKGLMKWKSYSLKGSSC